MLEGLVWMFSGVGCGVLVIRTVADAATKVMNTYHMRSHHE